MLLNSSSTFLLQFLTAKREPLFVVDKTITLTYHFVYFTSGVKEIGPSGVRALPLAAGRKVGGHYKWHFLIAQPKGWRLLHMETLCVCVCVCEKDNFEPRDWSTRLPE